VNDIEFVLVDKEQTPKDKNTKFRADINSRTGGINDPKKPVTMPSSQPAAKPSPSSSPAPAPKKQSIANKIAQSVAPKQTQSKAPAKATTTQKNVTPSPVVQQAVPKPQAARPQPPTAKPSVRPPMATPKTVQRPSNSPFKVPVPAGGTAAGQYATGPISGSGSSKNGGTKGSGTYSPNPSLAPVGNGSGNKIASGSGAGTGRGSGYGGSGSGSGGGNPGGGGGRPGIDAIKEPDFGPYMRELTRKIKMNWDPPKGNESKRVVLLFKIAKDGRLLSCSVYKSSGLQNADNAAINAVKLAAPFRPLPPEYKQQNIDIQFTFDYNVFGAQKY
jgi:TonB family protein